jgi:hypothetical protein
LQKAHGNDAVFGDLGGSLRDASDNMLWGSMARLEQTVVAGGIKFNTPRAGGGTYPTTTSPYRLTTPGRSPVSSIFAGLGGIQGANGSNFSETLQQMVPDYNKRDNGLYKDPPPED